MSDDDATDRVKSTAAQMSRELPPLLNIEHQELIRAVERAQVRIDTNHDAIQQQLSDLARRMDDRYDMQTKALDAAFVAQTTAMDTALTAANQAIATAFAAQEKATNADIKSSASACFERALAAERAVDKAFNASEILLASKIESGDKAISKAEAANERRFEAVNEFRAQLNDVITTLMPRAESEAKYAALLDKVGDLKSTVDSGFSGSRAAQDTSRYEKQDNRANIGTYIAVAGLVLTILVMIITNTIRIGGH